MSYALAAQTQKKVSHSQNCTSHSNSYKTSLTASSIETNGHVLSIQFQELELSRALEPRANDAQSITSWLCRSCSNMLNDPEKGLTENLPESIIGSGCG